MIVLMLFATVTFAQKMQEKDVPSNVKAAFKKQYPAAKQVKWDREDAKYEASFALNKIDNSVLIDAQGNIVETEVEIELNQLPKRVGEYVKINYAGEEIMEAAKIIDAKGTITYEAEIKGMDLIFDSNGKFVKAEKDKNEKQEKEN